MWIGWPRASVTACSFEFSPPFVRPSRRPSVVFSPQAGGGPVRLQMRRVDHQYVGLVALAGQPDQDAGKDTFAAPADPTVVERLGRTALHRCVTPTQPIAIDEDYSAQHASLVNAWLAEGLGKKGRSRTICASISQKRPLIALLLFPNSDLEIRPKFNRS